MRVNINLQLLLYLLGYRSPIIYLLWKMVLDSKSEEERTIFVETAIKKILAAGARELDLDIDAE